MANHLPLGPLPPDGIDRNHGTRDLLDWMIDLRRALHQRPERSGEEQATATMISHTLDDLGIQYRSGVGGHGIVADIGGREDGPVMGLRADIDALPVREQTGLPFASHNDGVMHACGHDGHTAMLLGAARLLNEHPPHYPVRLLFQPAEERRDGARSMISDGALEGVAAIFGGHLDTAYPTGTLVVTDGPVNAASDYFKIRIDGKSGHAARPHQTVDSLVAGAYLVTALQTVVAREVNPAHPAVLTVGSFQAGTAENVIAGSAYLAGTIRTLTPEIRRQVRDAVIRISSAVGHQHGCQVAPEMREGNPPVINSPSMATIARRAAVSVVGRPNLRSMGSANMGAEDFGRYLEIVPGCYVRYGGPILDRQAHPAHSSRFDFDETALLYGALWMEAVARRAAEELAGAD